MTGQTGEEEGSSFFYPRVRYLPGEATKTYTNVRTP